MAKSLLINIASTGPNVFDNLTRFFLVSGCPDIKVTEELGAFKLYAAITASNLYVRVSATTITVSSSASCTVRKNETDTSITCSWAANTTGVFTDDVNTASFSSGDTIDHKVVTPNDPSGGYALQINIFALTVDTAGSTTHAIAISGYGGFINDASATYFYLPAATTFEGSSDFTESKMAVPLRAAFTVKGLQCYVGTARATATTLKVRKNSGDGNSSISINTTGFFEDADSTDSFAVDDTFCLAVVTGTGTDNLKFEFFGCVFENSAGYTQYLISAANGFASGTWFVMPFGKLTSPAATESDMMVLPQFTFDVSKLQAYRNTSGAINTITIRDNQSDGTVTVSYADGDSGIKVDTTHTDTITGGSDELCVSVAGNGLNLSFKWISFLGKVETDSNIGRSEPFIIRFRSVIAALPLLGWFIRKVDAWI